MRCTTTAVAVCALVASFSQSVSAKTLLPPRNEVLIGLLQPLNETHDPRVWNQGPAAVISATSLRTLGGLTEPNPNEALTGRFHATELIRRYPNSALVLALWVGGMTDEISRGALDAQIDRLAQVLESFRRPVYLRFGYEFEAPWNAFGPDSYVAAWKHFRQRLRNAGARNVAMVWHAAATCGPSFGNHHIERWYPGDEEVDWVGLSYYNAVACAGLPPEGLVSFARQRGKPVMIAESAPKGFDVKNERASGDGKQFWPASGDQIWNAWFSPTFRFINRNSDVIRMFCYFNENLDAYGFWGPPYNVGYWGDSRLETNKDLLIRWQHQTLRAPYRWADPRLFSDLGYTP